MGNKKENYDKTAFKLVAAAIVMMFICPIIGFEFLSGSLKLLHYIGAVLLLVCPFIGFILFVLAVIRRGLKG